MSIDIDQRLGLKSVNIPHLPRCSDTFACPLLITVLNSSCGKVMFHRCLSVHRGRCTPPGRQTPYWETDTPRQTPTPSWEADTPRQADNPLADRHPLPSDGYCSGRYASYCNAFLLKFMPSIYDCCRPWRNSVSRERSQPASRRRWRGDMYPGLGTASSAEVSAALSRMTLEILFTSPWITWLFYSTNMANKCCQNRSIW